MDKASKITLEQVKYQCRIDHDDENELLNDYILSAYDYVENYTGRTLYVNDVPDDVNDGVVISPSINQACLMIVAHWYANREVIDMPFSVHHLLQPYRLMGV